MTDLQIESYLRKPFQIEAVKVTEDNMVKVAEWCGGDVFADDPGAYIKVRVYRALNVRQTQAFVGDWVLYAGTGYKVYTDKAFHNSFTPLNEEADLLAHVGLAHVPSEDTTSQYAKDRMNEVLNPVLEN